MNVNGRKEYKTACRGCHGGCSYILTVEDGRLIKAVPDPDGPLNRGRGCIKGLSIMEQMYHPDRLTHPMKRIGEKGSGKWKRISWEEAYDEIAEHLQDIIDEYGAKAIAAVTGTGRHHCAYLTRFMNVLGSPNRMSAGALICLGPRVDAGKHTAGVFAGVDYYGDVKPAGIIVWGSNPAISGPDGELQWHIKDVIKAGTRLLVVDPYPTELAKKADIWLKVRPGTDGALAMAILNILIIENQYDHEFVENWAYGFYELKTRCAEYDLEKVSHITGIPTNQIVEAARWIAQTKPLSLEWGPAFEQSINAFQTSRAIFMIPAITGNWDIPGGFVEGMELAPVVSSLPERVPEEVRQQKLLEKPLSRYNAPVAHPYAVFEAMKGNGPYRIHALISSANNTLLSFPDSLHTLECLKALDYFVYMDLFMTPTAELADIVLPVALWPEVDCLFAMPEFGDCAVLCQQKAVQTGECRSDEQIFFELAGKMGLDYGAESHEELLDGILKEIKSRHPEYMDLTLDKLRNTGWIAPKRKYLNYKERGGFNTKTGKFELYSLSAKEDGADPLPFWMMPPELPQADPELAKEFPLILTTGRRQQPYFISNNRQIWSLRKREPFPLVSMNPETAAKYGISEGDWVWIESPRGKITQKAELLKEMKEDVVCCQFGWWYPEAVTGDGLHGAFESNANVLTWIAPPFGEFGSYQMRGLMCHISRNTDCRIEQRYHEYMEELNFRKMH